MHAYQQNTDEWLEMRKHHIGASDAAVIMEVSPWSTPYQLWEEKVGIRKPRVLNAAMARGNKLEDAAREAFIKMTGIVVFDEVVFRRGHSWMMASLDGIDIERKNIVEIKCPGPDDHDLAVNGFVPPKYYPQLQHQMAVTGLDQCHYFSFDGREGVIVMVNRNDSYIEKLVQKEYEFYECMLNLEPPKLTERDYEERHDDLWNITAADWIACQNELEKLKAREEELRETLVGLSGNANSRGSGIKVSRIVRKGSVDYKSIPELEGIDLNQYRKPTTECWRISQT